MKLRNLIRLNWWATMRLNYCAGGLSTLFRMPVKVYGKLRLDLRGKLILPENAQRNTLIIGSEHEDYTATARRAQLSLFGTWKIGGCVRIGIDSYVGIAKGALLEMQGNCFIGRDTQIHCFNHISFGEDVFAGELYVTDSDAHSIIKEGKRHEMYGEVTIGKGTYLGFRTILLKGTNIPPFSVVASGAVCCKNYRAHGHEKLLLAGVPACIKHTDTTALF